MKIVSFLFASLVVGSHAAKTEDKTITRVVKILQDMMAKSKREGDEEREIYAKFKCFCDQNEAEKRESIDDRGKEINVLSSKIEELQGSTGGLSTECAQLRSSMMANENARAEATSIRTGEHEDFVAEETDMTAAIGQMNDAIDTLSEIGADQTLGDAAGDNEKFMAGFSALSVKSRVKAALEAVTVFLNPGQKQKVQSFLQARAPFTGSYSSQSGQIVGTLKSMRDTFRQNLATARSTEKQQLGAYDKLMDTLNTAYGEMETSYNTKQENLGGNDGNLASKKTQLTDAKTQKASDEDYLEKLLAMCEEKTRQYNERKMLRANEDAAVSEAIAILNSDEAFAAFGKTDATSTGATGPSFLQLRSRRVRIHQVSMPLAEKVQKVLLTSKSSRVAKIAKKVKAENIFDTVLKQIDNMLQVIVEEGTADSDNLNFCNTERTENDSELSDRNNEIATLNGEIDGLDESINDPETGLKKQIEDAENDLKTAISSMKTETKERTEANLVYQEDIKNLVAAEAILKRAIKVLKAYYDKLGERIANEFIQVKEDPVEPESWGNYRGGNQAGNDAIGMLEYILQQTIAEETESHGDEESAQHAYEDSMADLKTDEETAENSISSLNKQLADAEETLVLKRKELRTTEADKKAIEDYLLKIKPGCDFITEHFDEREANRATETTALNNAKTLIKDTPVYQTWEADEHVESFGDCKEPCVEDETHVKCKACMAETTIPGYCAGHAGTPGC